MWSKRNYLWASTRAMIPAFCLLFAIGCSGGKSAPTTIYEGGGTIPEIVEQPAKASPTPAKGSQKR